MLKKEKKKNQGKSNAISEHLNSSAPSVCHIKRNPGGHGRKKGGKCSDELNLLLHVMNAFSTASHRPASLQHPLESCGDCEALWVELPSRHLGEAFHAEQFGKLGFRGWAPFPPLFVFYTFSLLFYKFSVSIFIV